MICRSMCKDQSVRFPTFDSDKCHIFLDNFNRYVQTRDAWTDFLRVHSSYIWPESLNFEPQSVRDRQAIESRDLVGTCRRKPSVGQIFCLDLTRSPNARPERNAVALFLPYEFAFQLQRYAATESFSKTKSTYRTICRSGQVAEFRMHSLC